MTGSRPDQRDDVEHLALLCRESLGGAHSPGGINLQIGMLDETFDERCNGLGRKYLIGASGVDQALRHPGEGRDLGILGDAQTSDGLDSLRSSGAVRTRTGQHHRYGLFALLARQ